MRRSVATARATPDPTPAPSSRGQPGRPESGEVGVPAGDGGSFSIVFNKAGPWMIEVETTTEEPGEWTATYSNPYYKEGDLVSYEKVWHRSSLTLWVR
jgi:hypothetical protein